MLKMRANVLSQLIDELNSIPELKKEHEDTMGMPLQEEEVSELEPEGKSISMLKVEQADPEEMELGIDPEKKKLSRLLMR